MRRGIVTAALPALLLVAGCREAVDPFRPNDRAALDAAPAQLTYSPGDDRTPVWSANGDSIYYTALHWDGNPVAPATILSIPARQEGPARVLLANAQVGRHVRAWLGAPALAPNGHDLAFVHLRLLEDRPCAGQRVCPLGQDENLSMVRLTAGELHSRTIGALELLDDDVMLPLAFEGLSSIVEPGVGLVTVSEYHPFQIEFEYQGRAIFRPSWNPASGVELVVSDGLRLLRWQLGTSDTQEIPGTADGVSPAWSPDGEWIAYTRLERTGSETFDCQYVFDGRFQCAERRVLHQLGLPQIVLTRPDGSEERVLGPGADPAWAPDGSAVYAASPGGGIVRLPLDGGAAEPVPDTQNGVEPAVSPDGRRLAFARRSPTSFVSRDIWVVDLP